MNEQKDPTDVDVLQQFRAAMRVHAASVTIITTKAEGRRFGMTGTAVTSLTMDPPALAACINRSASIHGPLLERGMFCVNILRAGDADFCRSFSKMDSADRFTVGEWIEGPDGLPVLRNSQASIICRVGPTLPFGSHSIVIGLVDTATAAPDVEPLLYADGSYRVLKASLPRIDRRPRSRVRYVTSS